MINSVPVSADNIGVADVRRNMSFFDDSSTQQETDSLHLS